MNAYMNAQARQINAQAALYEAQTGRARVDARAQRMTGYGPVTQRAMDMSRGTRPGLWTIILAWFASRLDNRARRRVDTFVPVAAPASPPPPVAPPQVYIVPVAAPAPAPATRAVPAAPTHRVIEGQARPMLPVGPKRPVPDPSPSVAYMAAPSRPIPNDTLGNDYGPGECPGCSVCQDGVMNHLPHKGGFPTPPGYRP